MRTLTILTIMTGLALAANLMTIADDSGLELNKAESTPFTPLAEPPPEELGAQPLSDADEPEAGAASPEFIQDPDKSARQEQLSPSVRRRASPDPITYPQENPVPASDPFDDVDRFGGRRDDDDDGGGRGARRELQRARTLGTLGGGLNFGAGRAMNREGTPGQNDWELRVRELSTALRQAPAEQRDRITGDLRQALNQLFDARTSQRERQITELEERIRNLREQLNNRIAVKDEIIQLRLQTLVNEANGLTF